MDVGRDERSRRGRRGIGALVCALAATGLIALPSSATAGAFGGAGDCQPYGNEPCLLPYPNNLFTKEANNSKTGLRVDMPQEAMPTNEAGAQIDVGPYNRNDGFSPGSAIVVRVPGLDNPEAVEETNPVPLTDMSQAFKKRAPIVLIDEGNKERQLIWVEIDSNADGPENTTLLIHPGENLKYGHTYVVAMRRLKDADGDKLGPPDWFKALREGEGLRKQGVQSEESRYEHIFKVLRKAGIRRGNLYEAWDFTVGSRKSLTKDMTHIRNAAFRGLGDDDLDDGEVAGHAPRFQVNTVENNPEPGIARHIVGTFKVPCYLQADGCPTGSTFNRAENGRYAPPEHLPGNVAEADFWCIVPTVASPGDPARGSLYGHGLLGEGSQVFSDSQAALAMEHNFILCATNWWGMSVGDVPYDISALSDLNNFPPVVDRLQQGVLNTLFLSRLMRTEDGFASDPAFQQNGQSLLDTSDGYFYGNSQGGIMGGITTAVAPDFTQSVLGVPGMDYGGLLLQRSSDFPEFARFLYGNAGTGGYPDTSIHPVLLSIMQQLWDRGEPNGYATRMTSKPLPNTPPHNVLMHVAYGDFQVSQYAAAVEARTIGAAVHEPVLDIPPRNQDRNLTFGIPGIESYPYDGSAIIFWDSGAGHTLPPPTTNTHPVESDTPPINEDPHSDPRDTPEARTQISEFLMPDGEVVDVCNGQPCHTYNFTP